MTLYFAYIWLIYSWTFIHILISYIFFVDIFACSLSFFYWNIFLFQLIFNGYLYIMVVEILTSHIHDKYVSGCWLPLVLFMTGLGSLAVLFYEQIYPFFFFNLWSNLPVLSINYLFCFMASTFGRFQSFSLRVVYSFDSGVLVGGGQLRDLLLCYLH